MRPRLVQIGALGSEFWINAEQVTRLIRRPNDPGTWDVRMSDDGGWIPCTDYEARQIMAVLNGNSR